MLNHIIYQNTVQAWLIASGIFLIIFTGALVARRLLVRQVDEVARRTRNAWDDLVVEVIERTNVIFLLAIAVYIASLTLSLHQNIISLLEKFLILTLLIQAAIWGSRILAFWSARYKERKIRVNSMAVRTLIRMSFILRVVLWTLIVLLALDNMGVDITTLVAGLGITGVAVALAVQNILKDLFGALSIVLDKPFEIGDFIIVGDYLGSIERIGLKTTRIRSISGEQLIFSNTDLLTSRIRNYKHMYERRVVFSINVVYDTPYDSIASIPGMLEEIVASREQVRFDRAHFKAYGEYALEYEIVYWMQDPDYTLYMNTQQAINLEIYQQFQREGIRFAYPTQSVLVQGAAPSPFVPTGDSDPNTHASPVESGIRIRTRRAVDTPTPGDGTRILVDGYWPPGMTKEDAAIDVWLKAIAPSPRLRRWFNHDPEKWVEFQQRYAHELDGKSDVLAQLCELVRAGAVTLVYSAQNTKLNTAVALGKYVRKHLTA